MTTLQRLLCWWQKRPRVRAVTTTSTTSTTMRSAVLSRPRVAWILVCVALGGAPMLLSMDAPIPVASNVRTVPFTTSLVVPIDTMAWGVSFLPVQNESGTVPIQRVVPTDVSIDTTDIIADLVVLFFFVFLFGLSFLLHDSND